MPTTFQIDAIEAAASRIRGHAVRTPLLRSTFLDEITGARVFVKPEMLQVTGSFKFRGAFNRLSQIAPDDRAKGVVAWSSGNHAQGVAAAARMLGIPATIVMPADAPHLKIENTKGYGARVRLYDRINESREAIGAEIAAETGAIIVPPYDDHDIMAGQGTLGLEMAEDAAALGVSFDDVLVPCSGGGIASGVATAIRSRMPDARIWTVEPEHFDDAARSLKEGRILSNEGGHTSICDALLAPSPGNLTFAVLKERAAGGLTATDDEALTAMAFAFQRLKLVAEPGGALALAALLAGRMPTRGRTIGVVLSGGNVDRAIFERALGKF